MAVSGLSSVLPRIISSCNLTEKCSEIPYRRSGQQVASFFMKNQSSILSRRTSRLLSTLCLYKSGYDFKRLFTISEYNDHDRTAFYKSIQSVRDNNMDMTGWLDYFLTGLERQMVEVRERGEQVIRRDVLVKKHRLNHRQAKALGYLFQHRKLTIQNFEALCPAVNRHSLQRDLKGMINKKLIVAKGATNQLIYWLEG